MNTAERIVEEDRRQVLLVALLVSPGYKLPVRALRERADLVGYVASMDRVRTDCAWLAEQGLMTLEADVATLTERGSAAALGQITVPGVRRPLPGADHGAR